MSDLNARGTPGGRLSSLASLDRIQAELDSVRKAIMASDDGQSSLMAHLGVVRLAIRARRAREAIFGAELFADPAWDILLEAYAATVSQRRTSVMDLAQATPVPSTTALRWINKLEKDGWLERLADPLDARRYWLELTPKALAGMRRLSAETQIGWPV